MAYRISICCTSLQLDDNGCATLIAGCYVNPSRCAGLLFITVANDQTLLKLVNAPPQSMLQIPLETECSINRAGNLGFLRCGTVLAAIVGAPSLGGLDSGQDPFSQLFLCS